MREDGRRRRVLELDNDRNGRRFADRGGRIYETRTLHFNVGRYFKVSKNAQHESTTVSYKKVVKQMKPVDKKAVMAKRELMAKKAKAKVSYNYHFNDGSLFA